MAVADEVNIRILVHRQNIHRYKFLLETQLTEVEHAFIRRRLAEEEAELRRLNGYRQETAADAAKGQAADATGIEGGVRPTILPTTGR